MNQTTHRELSRNPIVIAAAVLATGFLVCAFIASYTFYAIRSMDNLISVTGSAKQSITADQVKWSTSISRQVTASTLKEGYASLASDLKIVQAYFAHHGFESSGLVVSTVYMDEVYDNNSGQLSASMKRYTLRQTIDLTSKDIAKVDALSKNTSEVIEQGVIFQTSAPEYSYSDLASLRVNLLSAALKDASARADSIASVSGNKVGKLKSASSGVVQVLPVGSNDVTDYGTYDTTSIQKDVMVTVRASFVLN